MKGLLYKELLNSKKCVAGFIIAIVFFTFPSFIPMPDDFLGGGEMVYSLLIIALCGVMYLVVGSMQQSLFESDDNNYWYNFICSTSLGAKSYIASKYIFSALISMATLLICVVTSVINLLIQHFDSGVIKFALILLFVQLFIRGVEYPFIVRYGTKVGNNLRTALWLLVVFVAIVYALFGDMSIFGSFEDFMNWAIKVQSGEYFSVIMKIIGVVLCALSVVLYFASYKISCKLFRKKLNA